MSVVMDLKENLTTAVKLMNDKVTNMQLELIDLRNWRTQLQTQNANFGESVRALEVQLRQP